MSDRELSYEDWIAEATRRFGADSSSWRFKCPCCGHVASVDDYRKAGATEGAIGFSCIGRWVGAKREAFAEKGVPGPCNYAGGGLFRLNPVRVLRGNEATFVFEFADAVAEEKKP